MTQGSTTNAGKRSTRIVIQCIYRHFDPGVCYRVVIYQDGISFQPLEFSSIDLLIAAFKTVDPEFDGDALVQDNSGQTHIVFAKDMLLSDAELASLMLQRKET